MTSKSSVHVEVVVILRADRLYAEVLRQFALQVFPGTRVIITRTVEAAAVALATEPADLFVTGVGASVEGDVLDLLLHRARQKSHRVRVLVTTAGCEYRILRALRTLGVDGVFDSATESTDAFLLALRTVAEGSLYWSQSILDRMQREGSPSDALFRMLTGFEQIVLSIIGDGCDDAVAARTLGVSPSTVSTVRRELHRKLHVQHRGELVRAAAQNGFVRFTASGVVRPGFDLLRAGYARKPRRARSIAGAQGPSLSLPSCDMARAGFSL